MKKRGNSFLFFVICACCILLQVFYPSSITYAGRSNETILDDVDDVFYRELDLLNSPPEITNSSPDIDIVSVTLKRISNTKINVTLMVNENGSIKNRNDFEDLDNEDLSDFTGFMFLYVIEIEFGRESYTIEYSNYSCEINGREVTNFSSNNSTLNISLHLENPDDELISIIAYSYRLDLISLTDFYIYFDFAPNEKLFTATINASKNTAGLGEKINFSAETRDYMDITIKPYTYNWDFGNNCNRQGKSVTYAYYEPGDYVIRLLVNDSYNTTTSSQFLITITEEDCVDPTIEISKPLNGLYLLDFRIGKNVFEETFILGRTTIRASPFDNISGIKYVDFYVDGMKQGHDETIPYEWQWNTRYFSPKTHTIKVVTSDFYDNTAEESIIVHRFA